MLSRGAWNEASPGVILCTGAHQGSLGTRLALGLYSILALTFLIRQTSNSLCLRRLNVTSSSSVRQKRYHWNVTHTSIFQLQALHPYKVHPNKECLYTGCHYQGYLHLEMVSLNEPGNKVRPGLYFVLMLYKGSRERGHIALGLYSALVLTRGDWKRV